MAGESPEKKEERENKNSQKIVKSNEQELMKQKLDEWKRKKNDLKESTKPVNPIKKSMHEYNLKTNAVNWSNKSSIRSVIQTDGTNDSSFQYKRLLNRNKAFRLATKITRLQNEIEQIDIQYKKEFDQSTIEITNSIQELKPFWEIYKKLTFIHSNLIEEEQKIANLKDQLKEIDKLNKIIQSSSQLFRIEGEVHFDGYPEFVFPALLSPDHLEILKVKNEINRKKLDRSLLENEGSRLELEIDYLNEQISIWKLKLEFICDKICM